MLRQYNRTEHVRNIGLYGNIGFYGNIEMFGNIGFYGNIGMFWNIGLQGPEYREVWEYTGL